MTDTTELPGILVTGNRRPHGSTGGYGGGGGGGANEPTGPQQNEVSPEEPYEPYQYDPCDTPQKRLDKAADSAAAEAVAEIARLAAAAGEDGLNYRERGCYLFRQSDGSVVRGPIAEGPPFEFGGVGSTPLQYGSNYVGDLIGSVHSHSAGNHLPSTDPNGRDDFGHFQGMVNAVNNAGGVGAQVRIYITAQRLVGPNGGVQNVISVYDQSNIAQSVEDQEPGPEVDPNGEACPPT